MENPGFETSSTNINMGCDSPRSPACIENEAVKSQLINNNNYNKDPLCGSPDLAARLSTESTVSMKSHQLLSDNEADNGEEIVMPDNQVTKTNSGQASKWKDKIIINVGGLRHITYRSTLRNVPDTRLSWLADTSAIQSADYDPDTGEFFFDRHPVVFSHVLNYYRTGKLHVPYDVCGPLYEEELQYWGIDDSQVESCCWISYRQHRDAQDTLKDFEGIELDYDADEESEPDLARYGFQVESNDRQQLTRYEKWLQLRPKIWSLFEEPTTRMSKLLAYLSMGLILLSVMLFCLETMESFRTQNTKKLIVMWLEGVCVTWFTIELIIRFIVCPSRLQFVKGIMNWIDFLAIVPFFVEILRKYAFHSELDKGLLFIQIIRVIRVFRIIKLAKHNVGLQILGHTLKASFRELFLLIFFLFIGIVIFSSLVYYCEKDEPNTKFKSIPRAFWWAVITMTTVGYGDMTPTNDIGKVVGGLCAITGVLMIALPVPVIVNNFNLYYSHAQARLKLPKKKRKVLANAANALKDSIDPEQQQTQITDDLENSIEEDFKGNNQCTVTINEDPKGNNIPMEELDQGRLRLHKFSRRDSKLFSGTHTPTQSTADQQAVRLSIGNGNPGQMHGYALQKRRSLLPGMSALPEIE
eukprot:gene17976-19772_t